jgi:asparagine synthase (glutamine-hydrolysing)
MLDEIAYRGPAGRAIVEANGATMGVVWTEPQADSFSDLIEESLVRDAGADGHLAEAQATSDGLTFVRDQLGRAPLYYGALDDDTLCFASEVKAMLEATDDVNEVPPGHRFDGKKMKAYFHLKKRRPVDGSTEDIAQELQRRLADSVERRVSESGNLVGSWLSGGLDSSTMAALARPHVDKLYTFAAGVPDAPDLKHAREVAEFIDADHREVIVTFEEMMAALPNVIYHLESFDALLVRSSITNYLVGKVASDYVPAVFSGEGGDELFAGYEYIKSMDIDDLPDELIDITNRLHNTALQRVDRSSAAHGTIAHVGFLDPDVVDYAMRIPPDLKLHDGVEKWILRRAMDGLLPESILDRTKSKFWEGAGVGEQLSQYAERHISDSEFEQERRLPGGEILNTKEELMYYRIFTEQFGQFEDLSWMGRTKGAPVG